jgi:hypothetical protein
LVLVVAVVATPLKTSKPISHLLTQISPRGDRVLVAVAEEETKTRGGILLPTSAIKKPTSGEGRG